MRIVVSTICNVGAIGCDVRYVGSVCFTQLHQVHTRINHQTLKHSALICMIDWKIFNKKKNYEKERNKCILEETKKKTL